MFAHLHVHTEYSLLDGMGKIKNIVKKVKESGMTACAITDHGVGSGLPDFYAECKSQEIKPILGCEFYEAPGSRFEKKSENDEKNYHHLILLVKNDQGYKNLCKLISRSNTEGFYYKPRIDQELLSKYHEGLICLSACIAGRLPRTIIKDGYEAAKKIALQYKNMFGEDYYLEIQNHGIREESIVAQELWKMSKELGIKLVCTNDCHYVNSDDSEAHEWLICMQTGKKIDDPHMKYQGDYSIKNEEEMRKLFPSIPEAFDNTMEIVDKCNFEFEYGHYRMPKVHIPESYGNNYFAYLEHLSWEGYESRYPEGNPERDRAKDDLIYELSVVKDMGFAEYFLDTLKTIKWAKKHDILVGPGRGSAAGCRMCYCLGITDIDPIKYDLLFERFLNPERISMPDIDVDYDYAHKDEVVASESESNGMDCFSKIQTFGTMKAKNVLRDCARVGGYPVSTSNALAKFIPNTIMDTDKQEMTNNVTLKRCYEQIPELVSYIKDNHLETLWEIALKLEGLKKSASTHACGHIPTPVPCEELYPVSLDKSGYLVCQYNMTEAEHLGNLKKDLLMLRNLTIIDSAHKEIKKRYGKKISLWTDEILNDKVALSLIAAGKTDGIFQLESEGMKKFMKDLKPSCFEDIIAGVSLYRPGPMDFIPQYIEGKQHPENITYLTPQLESILKPTYGVIVYQEQVMQIVRVLAGFSMGRADLVRKAMGKKKKDIMEAEGKNFIYGNTDLNIPGCIANDIGEDIAVKLYDQMIDFAKYAFNKSHAACYAAISMQTAYLKAHYLPEFEAGLLTSVMDKTTKLSVYYTEAISENIIIDKPDINHSSIDFCVVAENELSFGLLTLKGVGKTILMQIITERNENGEYKSLTDFLKRNSEIDKSAIISLIKSGAFDSICNRSRRAMVNAIENNLLKTIRKEQHSMTPGQMSLFNLYDAEQENWDITDSFDDMREYSKKEFLKEEKEVSGIYLSGSPLDEYTGYIKRTCNVVCSDLSDSENEEDSYSAEDSISDEKKDLPANIKIAGILTSVKKVITKKGKPMAFLTIEDQTGDLSVTVFPKQYEKFLSILNDENLENVVCIEGKNDFDGESHTLIAETVTDLSRLPKTIYLKFNDMQEYLDNKEYLDKFVQTHAGSRDNVYIYLESERQGKMMHGCFIYNQDGFGELLDRFSDDRVIMKI